MKLCDMCGKKMNDEDTDFKYFSDEGKQTLVCGGCFVKLKRKDYKSGENNEDGSSM